MIMDLECQLVVVPLRDATATSAWFCPGDALVFRKRQCLAIFSTFTTAAQYPTTSA